jgi:two-component system cell cycle sensor histidine kinase/response regulator CckA
VSANTREPSDDRTILLVDDEPFVRHLLQTVLVKEAFHVLPAEDGSQALHIAAHHPGAIHVLVTDIVMPGINGYDVAQRVRATRPEIKVLYITGHIESDLGRQCVADKQSSVLSKPFGPREFPRESTSY